MTAEGEHAARLNVVIIGAGRTGRGFLARFAARAGANLAFIDADEALVNKLNADGAYSVRYFGGVRAPDRIEVAAAAVSGTEQAVALLAEADLVFTAVTEQRLPELAPMLLAALERRSARPEPKTLHVLTGENGVQPGKALAVACAGAKGLAIGEAAIFCSTVAQAGADARLDIWSESYDELPYDSLAVPGEALRLPGMQPEPDMRGLLQRKIYTYNCLSACIAYLGALKGYDGYPDAANDEDIGYVLDRVLEPLNRALAAALRVDPEEQDAFSQRALRKFRDSSIRDDIARNARDVLRKLGPQERLLAPARMIREAGGDTGPLALVVAAALLYREAGETALAALLAGGGVRAALAQEADWSGAEAFVGQVERWYRMLCRMLAEPGPGPLSFRTLLS